jgi:NAD(P)-dependent dehydrogenase (short-subunit alcohol dehydrogenase family)
MTITTRPSPPAPVDLTGRRVLVPGGTGAVGEGVVRAYLAAGADVVVPTRTAGRAAGLRALLGDAASDRLHLVEHDYTSFAGARALVATLVDTLGGLDDVVAPVGGWWAGKPLWEIGTDDWEAAFVGLATTHMAIARAVLPHLGPQGAYAVVVGQSAAHPVPSSGLVSMEQAAVLMMQRVLAAEAGERARVFALVLGPVRTRAATGEPGWVGADEVGAVAVALSADETQAGREVDLTSSASAQRTLEGLRP